MFNNHTLYNEIMFLDITPPPGTLLDKDGTNKLQIQDLQQKK
jgi:hypothetical protein